MAQEAVECEQAPSPRSGEFLISGIQGQICFLRKEIEVVAFLKDVSLFFFVCKLEKMSGVF